MKNGANPNSVDSLDQETPIQTAETPLQIAIKNQKLEIMQVLLENGANPNYSDYAEEYFPAIEQALETENTEIIKMLLKFGADEGTFLHQAIWSTNNFANVEMLLKIGVEANIIQDNYGWKSLHYAIDVDNNIELINLLMRFGADINAKDFAFRTPLHNAFNFRVQDFKLLKVLLLNGANPNLKNEDGESTIEKALKHKATKYFKAILHNQCHF